MGCASESTAGGAASSSSSAGGAPPVPVHHTPPKAPKSLELMVVQEQGSPLPVALTCQDQEAVSRLARQRSDLMLSRGGGRGGSGT